MGKAKEIARVRIKTFSNFIIRHLADSPYYISLVILTPIVIYFIAEIFMPNGLESISINSDILKLIESFSAVFHQLLYYTIILSAPLYIMITQINNRSYEKYRHFNISYKDISLANMGLCLMMLDSLFFVILAELLMHTSSNFFSSIVFIVLFLFSFDSILFILLFIYQGVVNFSLKYIKTKYITVFEGISVTILAFLFYLPVKYVSLGTVMSIPFFVIICVMVLLSFVIYLFYTKSKMESAYVLRNHVKDSKLLLLHGNMNILKNYFLLLFQSRSIYIEYIFSYCILLIFFKNSNLIAMSEDVIFQLSIPLFLISSGILSSYKSWFDMKQKATFNRMKIIDFSNSVILLILFEIVLSSFMYNEVLMNKVIICLITYMISNLIQSKVNLKYKNDNKTPIIFLLFYGFLSVFIYMVAAWGLSYV